MGGSLQEVLQGRGDKKGKVLWLKRGLPLLFLALTWLGLISNFPVTIPALWFFISAATAITYTILHYVTGSRKDFSIEFLCSIALVLAGITQALNLVWLRLAFFPYIILIASFYSFRTVLPVIIFIPFLQLAAFVRRENIIEEIAFTAFLIITALVSSFMFSRHRKEKEKALSSLKTIKDNALNVLNETGMESLSSDKSMSHYFASVLKTDEEIGELLLTIKQAVFADSANLFVPNSSSFTLRCSTEEKGNIIISGKGMLSACMKDKKPFYSGEVNEKKSDIGYIKKGKISSVIATPVMDGLTPIGVLTVDSPRYQAFSEPDRNIVQMFANHLVGILERERIYPKIKRDYNGLKILNEESSKLVSSLNIEVIVEKLCEGAKKISSSQVFFFISRGRSFELIHYIGNVPEGKRVFDLKGTFINMAIENKQPIYMSDVTEYRLPIMPFKVQNVQSVLVIPMIYETHILGLFVMLSGEKDFIDTFQMELLKVMCNQASTSIANANLHAEIEKLATTDGLTGLFNHRSFQEKLSAELKRQSRFTGPLSLMLTDIDFFKKINDTYGHPAGDLVLKGVSKIIRETVRDIDIPARYGGEEFAVILPGADSEGAKKIAERLRKTIMNASFPSEGATIKVTISIGIATSPHDAKNKEELIERADQALYHAKHHGRNQSIIWSGMQ